MLKTLLVLLLLLPQGLTLRVYPPGPAPESMGVSPPSVYDDAVNYWRMEESGLADRVDSIGTDDATPSEAITTIAGKKNNAANFDADTHDLVAASWRAVGVNAFSASVWIKRQANVTESTAVYMQENTVAFTAFVGQCFGTGRVQFSIRNAANAIETAAPTADAEYVADWINVVNTWSAGNTVRIYRNGVLWGESPGTLAGPMIDHSSGIVFSGLTSAWSGGNEGYTDEVTIWFRDIGLGGAQEVFNNGPGKFLP